MAQRLADEVFFPNANATDRSAHPPVSNVRLLAEAGLLGLTTPTRYGGIGAPGEIVRRYTEILAMACGATTFTQGQHLSACTLITNGASEELRSEVLPRFATGERICGIAFAHVRRPGPPMLVVTEVEGGYLFQGRAAWFTGWGLMTDVIIAGTLDTGEFVYVVAPLGESSAITATPPMELCAMSATGTVSLLCDGLVISKDRLLKRVTPDQMWETDAGALLGVTPQVFGVTRAALRLIDGLAIERNDPSLARLSGVLNDELASVRKVTDGWRDRASDFGYKTAAAGIRAWAIEMGVRASHAALAAAGGSGNSLNHNAQRLCREAMFYTVTAQTRTVQLATFDALEQSSSATTRRGISLYNPPAEG